MSISQNVSLPINIWNTIFETIWASALSPQTSGIDELYLPHALGHEGYTTIEKLSRVCYEWRLLILPLLYRSIFIENWKRLLCLVYIRQLRYGLNWKPLQHVRNLVVTSRVLESTNGYFTMIKVLEDACASQIRALVVEYESYFDATTIDPKMLQKISRLSDSLKTLRIPIDGLSDLKYVEPLKALTILSIAFRTKADPNNFTEGPVGFSLPKLNTICIDWLRLGLGHRTPNHLLWSFLSRSRLPLLAELRLDLLWEDDMEETPSIDIAGAKSFFDLSAKISRIEMAVEDHFGLRVLMTGMIPVTVARVLELQLLDDGNVIDKLSKETRTICFPHLFLRDSDETNVFFSFLTRLKASTRTPVRQVSIRTLNSQPFRWSQATNFGHTIISLYKMHTDDMKHLIRLAEELYHKVNCIQITDIDGKLCI